MFKKISAAFAVLLLSVLTGCTVHKVIDNPDPDIVFSSSFSEKGLKTPEEQWWKEYNDQKLNNAVDAMLENNLSLKAAWDRLRQTEYLAKIAGAGLLPSLDIKGSTSETKYNEPVLNPTTMITDDTHELYSAYAVVGYQLDLWKKISSTKSAAVLQLEASEKNYETTAMTLVSTFVNVWFSVAEQQQVISLLNEQVKTTEEYLKLIELRSVKGLASALEVLQQKQQLEALRNQLPYAELKLKVLKNQLAVLQGREPGKEILVPEFTLPELPGFPDTGIPVEIIRNRPDVKSSELMLKAADYRLAAAIADRFPSISLGISFGDQASTTSELFDDWALSFSTNILAPLFDGGRRKYEVERNKALVEEAFHNWQLTIINSIKEVEDTVQTEKHSLDGYRILSRQKTLASQTLKQATYRYTNGLTDYLSVLNALNSFNQISVQEIKAKKELLVNRASMYLALGGNWKNIVINKKEKKEETFSLKELSNE